jgi:ATP-dependent helicase/DNAse subunit B
LDNKEKLDQLKQSGAKIYSFSKLGTFHTCQYEYYNTYVLKNKGIDNCYTILGSALHQGIESIYSGEGNEETFKNDYFNKLTELDLLGINFPNDKIKNSWVADVTHFINTFKKIESKVLLEQLIAFEIGDGIWMQGYIDAIFPSENGKPLVNIIDWKTSSKFTGQKLQDAGRQLLLYKIGLEDNTNYKVDKIAWFMIKYIYVCWDGKKAVKKKMCNRGKWVKEIRPQLETELLKLNIDELEREILLDKAVKDNSLSCMPDEIKDKYWLEDCVVEYEITDEKIDEVKSYVVNTVNAIESKNINNELEWEPVKIDKKNSFYCSVLCGHRKTCKYYKKFLEQNADGFDKKPKKDEFDIFS